MSKDEKPRLDAQDLLLMVGTVTFLWGISAFSWRISLIVAGVMCFVGVLLIEKAKGAHGSTRK